MSGCLPQNLVPGTNHSSTTTTLHQTFYCCADFAARVRNILGYLFFSSPSQVRSHDGWKMTAMAHNGAAQPRSGNTAVSSKCDGAATPSSPSPVHCSEYFFPWNALFWWCFMFFHGFVDFIALIRRCKCVLRTTAGPHDSRHPNYCLAFSCFSCLFFFFPSLFRFLFSLSSLFFPFLSLRIVLCFFFPKKNRLASVVRMRNDRYYV